jgi:DNA processing protein
MAGHLDQARARIEEVLELPDHELIAALGGSQRERLRAELERLDIDVVRARSRAAGLETICLCDPAYPPGLRELAAPPAVLHVAGGAQRLLELVGTDAVAIVGSRRASRYGIEVARSLGRGLALSGVTVVSGMALGIDSAAHAGALEAGARRAGAVDATGAGGVDSTAAGGVDAVPDAGGADATAAGGVDAVPAEPRAPTVAVLPGSPERPYPAGKRALHRQIVTGGAAVSELGPGASIRRWMFLARNRIIAALAAMTVVVEAGERSGALVTARLAGELGRAVGAVPGRVTAPQAAGPNGLLAGGARVVRGTQDVLDHLFGAGVRRVAEARGSPPATLGPLLAAVAEGHDTLAALARAGFEPEQGLTGLAALELGGYVRRGPGGRFTVAP